jgi:hypothetical protein
MILTVLTAVNREQMNLLILGLAKWIGLCSLGVVILYAFFDMAQEILLDKVNE